MTGILTTRQMEIAALLARGLSYKAIAIELRISVRTVEFHVHKAAHRIATYPTRPRDIVALWYARIAA